MAISFLDNRAARKILLMQFIVIAAAGLFFAFKSPEWGASALGGGAAVWLPNAIFMIFAWRHPMTAPSQGRVAWSFAIGEALKVIVTFSLLAVALVFFKAAFVPLVVTWLLVLVVQLLAPAVINNKG